MQEKESIRQIEEIEDAIHLAKEKSKTDAEFYKVLKEAEANRYFTQKQFFNSEMKQDESFHCRLLFTPEYLELKKYEAAAANRKVYFGPQLPNIYFASGGSDQEANLASATAAAASSGDKRP